MPPFRIHREFATTAHGTYAAVCAAAPTRAAKHQPALLACALLLLACVPDAARRGQAGREQGAGAADRPALDLTSDTPWPANYDSDPLWRRGAGGGDFELARLAQSESASSLLAALGHGGSLGRTALAALPYARDRREVVGRLCELVLGPTPPTSSWLLGSLYEAIANGPRTEEAVDLQADAHCSTNLRQVSERAGASLEDRDRALGAISLLAKPRARW